MKTLLPLLIEIVLMAGCATPKRANGLYVDVDPRNNYGIHISEEELEEYDLGETEKWDNKEEKIRKVD